MELRLSTFPNYINFEGSFLLLFLDFLRLFYHGFWNVLLLKWVILIKIIDFICTIKINVIGSNSFNLYNVMRITQIILGSLILVIGSYTLYSTYSYKNINKIPLLILILFGSMALFNGITSTCSISTIFIDYLN